MPRMPSVTMHQSWPATRRRRDSQPSIHLPLVVYLPGMKIGGSALTRFDLGAKKSSFAAIARPPTRADARSVTLINSCPVAIGLLYARSGPVRDVVRQITYPPGARDAARRSARAARLHRGGRLRGPLRHILYGGRLAARDADCRVDAFTGAGARGVAAAAARCEARRRSTTARHLATHTSAGGRTGGDRSADRPCRSCVGTAAHRASGVGRRAAGNRGGAIDGAE